VTRRHMETSWAADLPLLGGANAHTRYPRQLPMFIKAWVWKKATGLSFHQKIGIDSDYPFIISKVD
jgi:hypothetical protein